MFIGSYEGNDRTTVSSFNVVDRLRPVIANNISNISEPSKYHSENS
jgi:hypothetical protein